LQYPRMESELTFKRSKPFNSFKHDQEGGEEEADASVEVISKRNSEHTHS